MEIDIKKVKPGPGRVVIELVPMNDKVKLGDGTELLLDTTFEPSDHVSVCGTVIIPPLKLIFDRKDPNSMFWKTEIEVMPGDTAYFDYHAAMMALGRLADHSIQYPETNYFVQDGKTYIFLPYQDIFCVARDIGEEIVIIPVNGYVIIKPILKEHDVLDNISKIFVPYSLRLSQEQNRGVVLYVGKPNSEFLSEKICDVDGYKAGDTVMYKQTKIRKLEYDLHATLPKGLIIIQRSDINAIIDKNGT